jgi:hypothetical protein
VAGALGAAIERCNQRGIVGHLSASSSSRELWAIQT